MKGKVICIGFGLLLAVASQIRADTLNVGPGETYSTIQAAIDDANDDDTIIVAAGVYGEQVDIDKALTLQGAGAHTTIIDGTGLDAKPLVKVTASNGDVIFYGFTVQNGASSDGTNFQMILYNGRNGDNVVIFNSIIIGAGNSSNDDYGLYSHNGLSDLIFFNNVVRNCAYHGIFLERYKGAVDISFNYFISMPDAGPVIGFMTYENPGDPDGSQDVTSRQFVHDNFIDANSSSGVLLMAPFGWGYNQYKGGSFTNVEISQNTIVNVGDYGKGIQLEVDGDGGGIYGAVISQNRILAKNPGSGTSRGIRILAGAVDTVITHNTISGFYRGIYQSYSWGQPGVVGPTGTILNDNRIFGNIYGVDNQYADPSNEINAENNWWGDANGPNHPGNPGGNGDSVSDNVDYEPWLDADPGINILKLFGEGHRNTVYLSPDPAVSNDYIVIDMDALDLAQHVVGCQAVLNFNSDYFLAGVGEVDVQPGGGIWDELIWEQWTVGGDLDVAVGVDLTSAVGTKADGTIAKFTLTVDSSAPDGTTQMTFRPDVDDIESTFFADLNAQAVYPGSKIDSQTIVIDGNEPNVINLIAEQNQGAGLIDVLDCANITLQGTVEIIVDANDALAGLVGVPEIEVNGPETLTAVLVDSEGPTYGWDVEIEKYTNNGTYTITITATDKAGNEKVVTGEFCVNKNEVAGTVAMDTWTVAIYSFDRDVVFKATDSLGAVLKEWTVTVGFTNDDSNVIASGSYDLKDVPETTANLSAKTDWTLRRKVAVSFDGDSQGVADFTGDDDLLGGDLNGSNTTQFLDFLVLRNNWFTHEAVADINGDGNVQFSDFLILRQNWFTTGDDE